MPRSLKELCGEAETRPTPPPAPSVGPQLATQLLQTPTGLMPGESTMLQRDEVDAFLKTRGLPVQTVTSDQMQREIAASKTPPAAEPDAAPDLAVPEHAGDPAVIDRLRREGKLHPSLAAWLDSEDASRPTDGTAVPSPAPAPEPAIPRPVGDPGGQAPLAVCPRCEYDLKLGPVPEPTDAEKRMFLANWLADDEDAARFRETRTYLQGQIEIVYCTLTPTEVNAIDDVVAAEMRAGLVRDIYTAMARKAEYRLLFGVESIQRTGRPRELVGARLSRRLRTLVDAGQNPAEFLADGLKLLGREVLRSESLLRTVRMDVTQFNRKVAVLEARATDPNF